MKEGPIKIQMLGGFRISAGEIFIEEGFKRAPKLWKTLQYLIAFRHKSISPEELVAAIWPEDEQSDPKNAMHNMIFRIRSMLVSSGMPWGKKMILYSGTGYSWNNSLDCEVDCEEFERLYAQATTEGPDKQTRLALLLKAIDLYQGDYLPNASYEMWALTLASYFRSIYIKCAHLVSELLMEQEQYSQAEMICKKALLIDQFDEKINQYHLQSIIKQEKQMTALAEYQKMAALLYEEFGVEPSETLRTLYLDIQRFGNYSERVLEDMTQEWLESAGFPGAYYCEYGVFKMIYQIEARSVSRTGKSIFIISIAIKEVGEKKAEYDDIMSKLQEVIKNSLRKGDLFARAATNQYVLMLQSLTYEDCQMLSKRITHKFSEKHHSCSLNIKMRPISPVE